MIMKLCRSGDSCPPLRPRILNGNVSSFLKAIPVSETAVRTRSPSWASSGLQRRFSNDASASRSWSVGAGRQERAPGQPTLRNPPTVVGPQCRCPRAESTLPGAISFWNLPRTRKFDQIVEGEAHASRQIVLLHGLKANTVWTSKEPRHLPHCSKLFGVCVVGYYHVD
jgi:hypothetical protein